MSHRSPAGAAPVFGEEFNCSVLDVLTTNTAEIARNGRINGTVVEHTLVA